MATTFNKANNTTGLYLSGSWTQNALISSSYIGQFDSTVTTGITVVANAAAANTLNIGQLKILNPGGAPTITTGYIKYNTTGEDSIAIDMASASVNLNHTALIRTVSDIAILVGSASNNRILTFNGGVYVESASVTPTVTFDIAAGSSASSSAVPFQFATGARVNFLKKGGGTWYTNTDGGTHVLNSITIESGTVFWNPGVVANTFTVANGLYIGNGAIFKGGQAVGTTFGFISDVSGAGGSFQKQNNTGAGTNSFIVGNTNGIDGYYSGKFETLSATGVITITKTGTNKQTFAGNSTSTWTGGTSGVAVNGGVLQIWPGALGTATGNITLTTPGTLELSGTQTLTRIIAGTGDLIQTGSGVLVLSGANTYNGYTRIDQGSITAGSTTAIGSSILEYTSSRPGTFSFGNQTTQTFGGIQGDRDFPLTNANNAAVALTLNSSLYNTAYYGRLTGLGSLTKSGTGTFALYASEALAYSGTTTLAGGVLAAYHSAAFGAGGSISITADYAKLYFNQNTTFNRNTAYSAGVISQIIAAEGTNITYTGVSSGGNSSSTSTVIIDIPNGIYTVVSSSTFAGSHVMHAPFDGGVFVGPYNNILGESILRDLTANGNGTGAYRIIIGGGTVYEMSASTFNRVQTDGANGFRASVNAEGGYPLSEVAKGAGFSSINPNGTNIVPLITFQPQTTTGVYTRWSGPLIMGTAKTTSIGRLRFTGGMNLNGTVQELYVFNGATGEGSIGEVSGVITGSTTAGILIKNGPGKLVLSAKNTYIGPTQVLSGTLEARYIGLQYGSGSSTVGGTISANTGSTYRYVGSGSQTYATLDLSSGSNTLLIDSAAGAYFATMSLGNSTIISGAANQNVICEVDKLSTTGNLNLSGSNSWKISGLNASRTANTTALSGSKLIISREDNTATLGSGTTTIGAGATLETVTGESQIGKAKYIGSLTLGTAGSGAIKAKYKIGNGAVRDTGATIINGNLTLTATTNLQLNNATIFNAPGEYIIFKYTGTCTGFEFLNPSTNVAGRLVSHMRHDPINKRIYVTLS